jgi:predicted deacylase
MTVELRQFEFCDTTGGPNLLVTGGVHGDEFEPVAAIRRLIDLFQSQDHEVAGFRGRVVFVPVVNESAFLRGHRCGDDGLDLARTCPGRPDGSITEQTAWALSELIRSADYYIDLHTGGTELSVSPLAGYMMHSNPDVLNVQRRMARAFNLPIVWGTAANLNGRSLSVARDANVPAIYCEFLGAATCHQSGVDAYINGCLNVMSELGVLDRERPPNRIKHIVENPQPDSGHMQVCNPSPVSGYFETHVALGDIVQQGDKLGMVYPLDGSSPRTITTPHSGVVVVLRTFQGVHIGTSVGVVMELPS